MARERTKEEILDQAVYAVARVVNHYGPALNAEGLQHLRYLLSDIDYWCDSTWRVDVLEGGEDGNPDFHPSVLPDGKYGPRFEEVVYMSRTGEDA
jgi:hypothetical protein